MLRTALVLFALLLCPWSGQAQTVVDHNTDGRFALPDPAPTSPFEPGWTTVDPQVITALAQQGDPQAQIYARWEKDVPEVDKDRWMNTLHHQLDPTAAAQLDAYPLLIAFNQGEISAAKYRATLKQAAPHTHPAIGIALATLDAGGGAGSQTDLADTAWLLQQSEVGNVAAMTAACDLAVTPYYLVVPFLPLCRTLADQGNPQAAWQMAKVYLARSDDFGSDLAPRISQIFSIPRDSVRTVTYLQQAAERGHTGAQARLAHLKAIDSGITKDDKTAVRLAQTAAAQNNAEGLTVLGLLTLHGRGGLQPDPKAALELIRQGAERGNRMAQYTLATLLLRGQAMDRDFSEALMWLELLKLDSRSDPEPEAYGDLLLEPWPRTIAVASTVRSPAASLEGLRRAVLLRQNLAQKGLWPL